MKPITWIRAAGTPTLGLLLVSLLGCQYLTTPVPTPTAVPFKTLAFKVAARSSYPVRLDLPAMARVEYSFSSNLDLYFEVTDPQGNPITSSGRVLADEGMFTAPVLGRYTLVFDNGFSLFSGKNVKLRYRVVPPGGR